MSLDVPPELLDQAERGEIDEAAFVATVRRSLPYAYTLIERAMHIHPTVSELIPTMLESMEPL